MRNSGGTSKEGVKAALDLGLRIQGGKITGIAILGKQRRPRELVLHAGYPAWASPGGRLIPPPKGEHRRPPACISRHFGVMFCWRLSICAILATWISAKGDRERERPTVSDACGSEAETVVCASGS